MLQWSDSAVSKINPDPPNLIFSKVVGGKKYKIKKEIKIRIPKDFYAYLKANKSGVTVTRDLQTIHSGAHAEEYLIHTHINYRSVCIGAPIWCINLTRCRNLDVSSSFNKQSSDGNKRLLTVQMSKVAVQVSRRCGTSTTCLCNVCAIMCLSVKK